MDAADSLPPDASIGRVALRVERLDRLVTFYEDVIGLSTLDRRPDAAVLGVGGDALLVLTADTDRPPRGRDETGLFHVAIRVPTRAALAGVLERIEERWELRGASDHLVSEALYLRDPEDNGLEIYVDRPREDWPTEDGLIRMETLPLDLADLRSSTTPDQQLPAKTTVGHVHLEVSDLAATETWYTQGLGMGVRQRYDTSAVFLAAGDYHHHVGANVWNGRTGPATGRGLSWFEVRVPDEQALADVESRFDSQGIEVESGPDGIAATDPDDIEVRVVVAGTQSG